jgi:hypothetical protein
MTDIFGSYRFGFPFHFGELGLGQWKFDTLIFQKFFDHPAINYWHNDFVAMCNERYCFGIG